MNKEECIYWEKAILLMINQIHNNSSQIKFHRSKINVSHKRNKETNVVSFVTKMSSKFRRNKIYQQMKAVKDMRINKISCLFNNHQRPMNQYCK
jgi:hypothetical protein